MNKFFTAVILFLSVTSHADENCTSAKKKAVCDEKIVKDKVAWACGLVEKKGKDAVSEIKAMRFDCCGEPDYVWLQDANEKPKIIMHPVKPQLDNTDVSEKTDPDGVKLFVEFVKSVKAKPAGGWVSYKWTKLGEADATPKKSWVRSCKVAKTGEKWVVGSGTWQ